MGEVEASPRADKIWPRMFLQNKPLETIFSRVFLHRGAVGSQKYSERCAPFKLGLPSKIGLLQKQPGILAPLCLVCLRLAFLPVRHSLANPTTQTVILVKFACILPGLQQKPVNFQLRVGCWCGLCPYCSFLSSDSKVWGSEA